MASCWCIYHLRLHHSCLHWWFTNTTHFRQGRATLTASALRSVPAELLLICNNNLLNKSDSLNKSLGCDGAALPRVTQKTVLQHQEMQQRGYQLQCLGLDEQLCLPSPTTSDFPQGPKPLGISQRCWQCNRDTLVPNRRVFPIRNNRHLWTPELFGVSWNHRY